MDYAHRQGVRHNDLKPANILVNQDGQPKLLDFGIAALPGEVSQGYTPRYASREQKRGEPLDERSDVYSLGSVLSELVAGERKPADLANLLARAQAATPDERYRTPQQLAAEIRNFTG